MADTDPTLTVDVMTDPPYGLAVTDTLYYGVGTGTYTITAQSSVPLPGLASIDFGNGTSAGRMVPQNGAPSATVSHLYNFSPTSTFSNSIAITATDRADNFASVDIPIVRDSVPPSLTVTAQAKGLFIDVSWTATDELSGLDACTLTAESANITTQLSTDCVGSLSYPGVQDVEYVFTIAATDKVSNESTGSASATPSGVTKYYYLGAERVAMRAGDEVFYLHGDHLGSTSLTTDANGEVVSESRYYPYGTERFANGASTTEFAFTGQRSESGFGLLDYNARFFSPRIGRFISPDSIVPEPGNPQSANRFSYTINNPVKFVDSSGHAYEDGQGILWRRNGDGQLRPINLYAPGAGHSDRDLTYFAATQANQQANSGILQYLQEINGRHGITGRGLTFQLYEKLVGDGKPWDFKDQIKNELGESFRLCSQQDCTWVEYSTLGNILYGYTSMIAGFTQFEIRGGAGYAEARDPENKENYNTPFGYFPLDRLLTGFDDAEDYHAVGAGIEMYIRYGKNVSIRQFQELVVDYQKGFASGSSDDRPVQVADEFPYPPGAFTNPKE